MNLTKNGIASKCWDAYRMAKEHEEGVKSMIALLANAIYLGAMLEKKAERDGAAENTFLLSTMQATFLRKNKGMVVTQRLVFNETSEESLRSMSGAIVTSTRFEETVDASSGEVGRKVVLVKNDGDSEFMVAAIDPQPWIKDGAIFWVAEPFVAKEVDHDGMVLSAMTPTEREKIATTVRPASNFPQYLQRRRVQIEQVAVGTDYRNAWLEYHLVEIDPYDKGQAGLELEQLRTELGLSMAETTEGEEPEDDQASNPEPEQGSFVNTSTIDLDPIEQ